MKIGVDLGNVVKVYVDSDWAGCGRTRRITNGGCILMNGACLKTWSTTQSVVPRFSGEAECYAAVKGALEGMALESMMGGLGLKVTVVVHTDSSACKGICNRRGLGKLRHVEVARLWLQQHVQARKVTLQRSASPVNPADLFTKYLTHSETVMHSGRLGFSAVLGRSTQGDAACIEVARPECRFATRPKESVRESSRIQDELHGCFRDVQERLAP